MKLYVNPLSPNCRRVLAVASYLGLKPDIRIVDFGKGEHRSPEFLKLNPNGAVPLLEDGKLLLSESRAILHHLAAKKPEARLVPTDPVELVEVLRWQFWDAAHFSPPNATLYFQRILQPMIGGDPDESRIRDAESQVVRYAKVLDHHLADRPWLVGRSITVADFTIAATLMHSGSAGIRLNEFSNVKGWYDHIAELDAWQATEPSAIQASKS
ncbi:MAG TPA: glutathione S-transferase family protein [Polyangiaceae bacterium]|nr:glutathione S-transferase family protein [Polyangiaceae bacterium]